LNGLGQERHPRLDAVRLSDRGLSDAGATTNPSRSSFISFLAYAATAAELTLGVGLLVGYRLRAVSLASAALLLARRS
jgi:uncharacterized membrane protein YphA (DoxX/SURF4 family)